MGWGNTNSKGLYEMNAEEPKSEGKNAQEQPAKGKAWPRTIRLQPEETSRAAKGEPMGELTRKRVIFQPKCKCQVQRAPINKEPRAGTSALPALPLHTLWNELLVSAAITCKRDKKKDDNSITFPQQHEAHWLKVWGETLLSWHLHFE